MNPEVVAAVESLRAEGVLPDDRADLLGRVARGELVSVRIEIRAALYLGVLLLAGGVVLFVKENRERIGPVAIGIAIGLAAAACLAWVFRRSSAFTWESAVSTHVGFDYVLLLGALLVATDLAFLESQVGHFGTDWPWHLLAVAALYAALAYRFDSRMLLALALTSFAAWRGVSVSLARTSLGEGDPARLRVEALACGALFVALGVASERAERKAHFGDVYVNGGLFLALAGLLAGVFAREGWGGWLAALVFAAGATAFLAFRSGRSLPFALAVVAAWVGLQRLIFEVAGGAGANGGGTLLLSAASAAAALVLVVSARRRMRIP
jgi:hypothetical protein